MRKVLVGALDKVRRAQKLWMSLRGQTPEGVSEQRIVSADHHVAEQRKVGAARQAAAMDLGDDRLVHVEQRHAQPLRPFLVPTVVVEFGTTPFVIDLPRYRLVIFLKIIAGTEIRTGGL